MSQSVWRFTVRPMFTLKIFRIVSFRNQSHLPQFLDFKSLKQRDYFTYKIELGVVKTSKIQPYSTFLDDSSDSCMFCFMVPAGSSFIVKLVI